MKTYDWSTFKTRIQVNASFESLYRAWATRSGIEFWFLSMSEYKSKDGTIRGYNEPVQSGDTYAWRWHGWPDEVEEHGNVLECNGKDFFKFTFGDAGICSVTLKEEEGLPVVELVQTEIPTDDNGKHHWHLGCKVGWTFYMANMKSMFDGGIDLRNKNVELKNVINS